MDESSLDFQEVKNKNSGPITHQKLGKNQSGVKNKRPRKPVKGQKDIRSALKQKNDLLCYTKEFNKICKQSGIDIDSEQLQLAIALSKSLQQTETNSCGKPFLEPLSSHERKGSIHTTLQEYGFKVPNKNILSCNLKRSRKIKRCYKLISTSQTAKRQIITDKYTQVLFDNNDSCKTLIESNITTNSSSTDKAFLFQMASNERYDAMKNNDKFYVVDIIERCSNYTGNLLRDWSEIPGRPISPPLHKNNKINISEIDCSQEELNIILSGSLKSCHEIFKSKKSNIKDLDRCSLMIKDVKDPIIEIHCVENATSKSKQHNDKNESETNLEFHSKMNSDKIINIKEKSMLLLGQQTQRSISPDMFEDEVYILTEKTDTNCVHSQKSEICCESRLQDMDVTKCVSVASILQHEKSSNLIRVISQVSKDNNNTTRNSNDLMEITECVVTLSQPICDIQNIDLTQSSDEGDSHLLVEKNKVNMVSTNNSDEDTLPFVNLDKSNKKSLDDTIILDTDECLPINHINIPNSVSREFNRDYINKINVTTQNNSQVVCKSINDHSVNPNKNKIGLHQNSDADSESSIQSVIEELNIEVMENISKIDLTQNSNNVSSSSASIKIIDNQHSVADSGLGRNFDISVDYDEIIDQNNSEDIQKNCLEEDEEIKMYSGRNTDRNKSDNIDVIQNYIKNLEYNEIPISSFNFGSISILDNINEKSSKESLNVQNVNKNEIFLTELGNSTLDLKKQLSGTSSVTVPYTTDIYTPHKEIIHNDVSEATPNNKYIIKTEEVTPILDYESMSTPERNKELEKYGLKPFKRKRAVQLLTHLYNQTHPIVEQCSVGELISPSKKRKCNFNKQANSPFKKSPIKTPTKIKSPKQSGNDKEKVTSKKENNIYAVTKELPDIKLLECHPEDWIFQKREKAKVHSCKVPLHIAFHNYVSCRHALREAILRYEPINIDVIHKDLTASGHRFDPKDLLKFLDKKCVTVKTMDSNTRKRH